MIQKKIQAKEIENSERNEHKAQKSIIERVKQKSRERKYWWK